MPSSVSFGRLASGALLAVLLSVSGIAAASTATVAGGKKKSSQAGSVRFIDAPSGESPAAREKRLKRECKGRPNAGACLGMTQG